MINDLQIVKYKAIEDLKLNDLGVVNYLVGRNGSGKSSVLEALSLVFAMAPSTDQNNGTGVASVDELKVTIWLDGNQYIIHNEHNIIRNKEVQYTEAERGLLKTPEDLTAEGHMLSTYIPSRVNYFELGNSHGDIPTTSAQMVEPNVTHDIFKQSIENIPEDITGKIKVLSDILDEDESLEDKLKRAKPEDTPFVLGLGYTHLINMFLYLCDESSRKENVIVLIDEPEFSLNMRLTKKIPSIFEYFKDSNMQILSTSHSAGLIRHAIGHGQNIYHLDSSKKNDDVYPVWPSSDSSKYKTYDQILSDLGMSLNDVFYPASLIYVEGPSDIVYLSYWLSLYLKERKKVHIRGEDFDFMLYGGALARRYSVGDPTLYIDEDGLVIDLLNANRCVFFITDSDDGESNFEKAKDRIEAEIKLLENGSKFYKDDNVKSIEGYIPSKLKVGHSGKKVDDALKNVENWSKSGVKTGDFPFLEDLLKEMIKFFDSLH